MSTRYDFDDRVVLVTGASGSLGTATVDTFHEAGAAVCMTARHRPTDGATPLESERVSFYEGDFTDERSVEGVVADLIDDHGGLDVLVNLIGGWGGGSPIEETDTDTFDFMFDVNLKTMFLASKHSLPHLQESGGSIVSTSARRSLSGGEGDGPYRAAKAGVRILTETIAEENQGRVRANAIMPSIIDTPDNREMLPDADRDAWPSPEAIAQVILFLCSDASSVTSGAAVPVYGDI